MTCRPYARNVAKRRYDTEATRAEILRSARAAFAEVGYATAKTSDIVARLGLTRGALYHQFGSKEGLFEAVLEDVQVELAAEVRRRAAASSGDTVDALRAGFRAYLEVATRPDVRRILMVDGPAVLGWERWQEIDLRHAFGVTRSGLARAIAAGEIGDGPLDELTHVLLGAATHAGLELGRASAPRATRRLYVDAMDRLLDGLRTPA